mmetsp:Transcript_16419/g.51018  ORF Transcript_16419/g.51018 Transcript_16419/m.51018 type:complete len:299 (-) Transcript_16419:667-1563(-)
MARRPRPRAACPPLAAPSRAPARKTERRKCAHTRAATSPSSPTLRCASTSGRGTSGSGGARACPAACPPHRGTRPRPPRPARASLQVRPRGPATPPRALSRSRPARRLSACHRGALCRRRRPARSAAPPPQIAPPRRPWRRRRCHTRRCRRPRPPHTAARALGTRWCPWARGACPPAAPPPRVQPAPAPPRWATSARWPDRRTHSPPAADAASRRERSAQRCWRARWWTRRPPRRFAAAPRPPRAPRRPQRAAWQSRRSLARAAAAPRAAQPRARSPQAQACPPPHPRAPRQRPLAWA